MAADAAAAVRGASAWGAGDAGFQPLHQVPAEGAGGGERGGEPQDGLRARRGSDARGGAIAGKQAPRTAVPSLTPPSLQDIDRTFGHVLDLGAHACNIARALATPISDPGKPDAAPAPTADRISSLVCAEASPRLLHRDAGLPFNAALRLERTTLSADSELLSFAPESFDAILSSLALHWANDLPSVLAQCNALLKPDAPLLAAMLGGDSLFELRTALQLASLERRGGLAQHTSPLADVRDVGGLLQRAGFKMLTVDVDDLVVGYPDIFALMKDLQAMGESNAVLGREAAIGRDVLLAADAIYKELHGEEVEGRSSLPATFRVIYFIAWKEGPNQAKPLPRGSADISMKDVLEGGVG